MNVNLANGFGIVRTLVDLALKQPEGTKLVLLKDPNKVRLTPACARLTPAARHQAVQGPVPHLRGRRGRGARGRRLGRFARLGPPLSAGRVARRPDRAWTGDSRFHDRWHALHRLLFENDRSRPLEASLAPTRSVCLSDSVWPPGELAHVSSARKLLAPPPSEICQCELPDLATRQPPGVDVVRAVCASARVIASLTHLKRRLAATRIAEPLPPDHRVDVFAQRALPTRPR